MQVQQLKTILKSNFGHSEFRFDQLEIIQTVLAQNDAIAIMPTGGGKSVCYQVPALFNEGITLVVSPLISLMHDQVMNLKLNGIEACFLNSSQDLEQRQRAQNDIINGSVKLVYVSPEGLLSGRTTDFLKQLKISLIAIDEAHCVSQWGHEFRADYMRLGELKEMFPGAPVLALTATADEKTRADIALQLNMENPKTFVSSFDRPNINYQIAERSNELAQLIKFIKSNHPSSTGIVYCLSRKKVERVANELSEKGLPAMAYHAGLSSERRHLVEESFNRKDHLIVVATIAFGMGIDRPDVRFVAHLDLPKSIEAYYQETGRAGRDGKDAQAWMVYGLQDVIKLSGMLESTSAGEAYKQQARHKLDSMLALCETVQCRRAYLLNYFGEDGLSQCDNCDACLTPAKKIDATVDAQKLLSTIYRTGEMFGAGHVIDVLRESKSSKLLEKGHDKLSCYGIGKDQSKQYWNSIVRQLLNLKYIKIKNWDYRNLALTQKAKALLKGEESFELRKPSSSNLASARTKKSTSDIEATHGMTDLFEELRVLRAKLAGENNVPPYIIFSDKSLHDMCQLLPRDRDEFMMVNGVGLSKCESYAAPFLGAISRYL